jgi:hypothetical protein
VDFLSRVQISCFLFSYLASLSCELWQLVRGRHGSVRALVLVFTIAGFVAHSAFLITRSRVEGLPPLLASQQDWLLVLAWLGSLFFLMLLLWRSRHAQGLFLLPTITALVIYALFVSAEGSGTLRNDAGRRWGMLHAASLVLGMASVAGVALSGLMYLLHHSRLKNRRGWLMRLTLPSLEILVTVNRWLVIVAVPCLTAGLITGFMLIFLRSERTGSASVPWTDPTILTTVIAWLAMTAVLWRTLRSGNRSGRSMATLSLLSGGLLLVTVLGPLALSRSSSGKGIHGGSVSESAAGSSEELLAVEEVSR